MSQGEIRRTDVMMVMQWGGQLTGAAVLAGLASQLMSVSPVGGDAADKRNRPNIALFLADVSA
jgi:hypothetical protein